MQADGWNDDDDEWDDELVEDGDDDSGDDSDGDYELVEDGDDA